MKLKSNMKGGDKMLNQVIIVGRITKDIELKESENGKEYATITLAVPRSFKNEDGVYDTDFIPVKLFDKTAETTSLYCHKGDIVGVKGRMQSGSYEKDGENKFTMDLIAEKVKFLSSKNKEHEDRDER